MISTFISLFIAVISLIIGLTALNASKIALNLSSKEYTPQFTFKFKDDGKIKIYNPYPKLYKIASIELMIISKLCIEDTINKGTIYFSYIKESKYFSKDEYKNSSSTITINTELSYLPCALDLCRYNPSMIKSLKFKLEEEYNVNSSKGYMPPSMQTQTSYIIINYQNKNNDRKSVITLRRHIHGFGEYDMYTITQDELKSAVQETISTEFTDVDLLWNYVKSKYFHKW